MTRSWMAVLGLASMLAALAACAVAQEGEQSCCTTSYAPEGKHLVRKEYCPEPFEMPSTTLIQVAPGEQQEGDFYAYRTEGKRTVRIYLREVPVAAPEVAQGHECSYRYRPVGKSTVREQFCIVNGQEQRCPGMNTAGECLGKK